MANDQHGVQSFQFLLSLLLAGAIFILDISLPLGIAAGVLYCFFMLTALRFKNSSVTIIWGILASALIVAGYYLSPQSDFRSTGALVVGINRLLSFLTVWVITILVLVFQSQPTSPLERDRPEHWNVLRTFLLLFLPLSLMVAGGMVFYFNQRTEDALLVQQRENLQSTHLLKKVVDAQIEELVSEAIYLSSLSELNQYFDQPTDKHRSSVEKNLTVFLGDHNFYHHISIFDNQGNEKIKVLHEDEKVFPANAANLSRLALSSQAVRNALQTEEGNTFLCIVMINDSLQNTNRPVLLTSIPLSNNSQKVGTLIAAYLPELYLDELLSIQDNPQEYLVLDQSGNLNWGNSRNTIFKPLFNDATSFGDIFPKVWQATQENPVGVTTAPQGLFSFLRLAPKLNILQNLEVPCNLITENFDLRLVLFTPKKTLTEGIISNKALFKLILIALLLIGILTWVIAWFWVSRSKRTKQIKDLHDKLNKFFKMSSGLLCIASTDGYFTRLSNSWKQILGYEIEDIKSKPFIDFIHPDDVESTENVMTALQKGESIVGFENRYKDKEGNYHWLSWTATMDPESDLIYASAVDLTKQKEYQLQLKKKTEELKAQHEELEQNNQELETQAKNLEKTQEELKQYTEELERKTDLLEQKNDALQHAKEELFAKARELERVSKFKSDFLANMSHELRTPLNSINIFATLLEENKQQNLTDKQAEFASIIKKCGNDLLLLINDILDLSKIESGRLDYIVEEVVLQDTVNDMDILFRESAHLKEIQYKCRLDQALPAIIKTDGLKLEQILKNLLSNAFKFTDKGGKVTLEVKTPDPGLTYESTVLKEAEKIIAFAVSDTGIGIPKDKQAFIFEAFQQADGSLKRKFGGTGLGLAICTRLAAGLGGELRVESEEGKGSTFTLLLPDVLTSEQAGKEKPKTKQQDDQRKQATTAISSTTRQNVLIIEDDKKQSNSIKAFVKNRFGIECRQAFSGKEALDILGKDEFVAIILDLGLKDMDGAELIRNVKKDKLIDASVLIYTGKNITEDQERQLHEISDTIILKTANSIDRLADELSDVLKKPTPPEENATEFYEEPDTGLPTLKGKKLLLAEDDLRNVKALNHVFAAEDVEMIHAANGKEALDLLEKNPDVDLVLMDIMMPEMDGLDAIKAIRKKEEFKNLPVITLTAKAMQEDKTKSLEAGASDYIAKPVNVKKLLNLIRLWISAKNNKKE